MLEYLYTQILRLLVVACRPPAFYGTAIDWWHYNRDMPASQIRALLAALASVYFHPFKGANHV